MIERPELKSDCDRCAALCCIAYAAEKSPSFSVDKQAGEPCPNLDQCGQCTIYSMRKDQGFSACLAYECFGAGQHVVKQLYGGQDWRDDPALLAPILESFHTARKAFELLYLIDYARKRELNNDQRALLPVLDQELLEITAQREYAGSAPRLKTVENRLRSLFAELGR